ncbi:hypothetical protein HanXRQr2_Chr03g0129721 [Helianthus annuus]|uniref:Uncharacterized protein n=1 Tax=Helianthus annuus TaxID=4232 RepID=A0A9K3NWK8_HELAN|nr:hypothetical protein HanXRQr2_Chr03g0129721 [Helianthus annuus]KAJ0945296.1 hypothetical protein HanPSC8_Chr03g0126571 [Helianthus annuus]
MRGSTISYKWLFVTELTKYVAKFFSTFDLSTPIGIFPVMSSARTTPKLYTSLFYVSWLVLKYSGSKYPSVP